jgi:hypothetical protein
VTGVSGAHIEQAGMALPMEVWVQIISLAVGGLLLRSEEYLWMIATMEDWDHCSCSRPHAQAHRHKTHCSCSRCGCFRRWSSIRLWLLRAVVHISLVDKTTCAIVKALVPQWTKGKGEDGMDDTVMCHGWGREAVVRANFTLPGGAGGKGLARKFCLPTLAFSLPRHWPLQGGRAVSGVPGVAGVSGESGFGAVSAVITAAVNVLLDNDSNQKKVFYAKFLSARATHYLKKNFTLTTFTMQEVLTVFEIPFFPKFKKATYVKWRPTDDGGEHSHPRQKLVALNIKPFTYGGQNVRLFE